MNLNEEALECGAAAIGPRRIDSGELCGMTGDCCMDHRLEARPDGRWRLEHAFLSRICVVEVGGRAIKVQFLFELPKKCCAIQASFTRRSILMKK